jgi:Right handed beta helix region
MIKNFTYLLLGILMMPIVAFSQEKESGPSRRAAWERSITKDPKTGLIPRNELEKARTSMLKSARISAAINTINWKERGPNNVGGRTRALMFDPNDATNKKVWAGGVSGGLWYNNDITDANSSWNKVNDFWDNIAIGDIAFDPSNKQIMYAGTGERGSATVSNIGNSATGGNGIWKTTNGGTSWTRLTSTIPDYVSSTPSLAVGWREIFKIIVNSTGTVFVLNMNGIYKSTDGGVSWTTLGVTAGPSPSYNVLSKVTDMELGTDDILYVSEGSGDNAHQPAIYKATSTAATSFTTITPTIGSPFANCRVELALAPSTSGASQVIYAIGATSHSLPRVQFFRKSINAGTTWTNVTVPQHNDEQDPAKPVVLVPNVGDQGDYGLILGVHATNPDIIYAGGVAFNISYNGGSSWLPIVNWVKSGEMMHNDHHSFARRPGTGNENHAIFGHDGGVSYSANWGINPPAPTPTTNGYPTFETRVKNYNVTQYFAIDVHNSTENLIGGAQDNGTHTITSASSTVGAGFEITGGDGGVCFFDQNDANIVISSYTNAYPYINNQGPSVKSRLDVHTNSKRGRFINPAEYDSPNHTLYMDYSLEGEPNARIIRYHVTGSSPNYTAPNDTLTLTGIPSGSANPNSGISFLKLGKSTTTKTLYIGMATGDVYKVTGIQVARNTAAGDLVIPAASITKIMDKSTTAEGNVSSIDYGTTDENIMVVTKSNYNIKSVFYTTNGGTEWTSKDETAHGLPNIPIRYALISPLDNKNVLLATELGVWSTQDITATNPGWESTNYQTLANVRVDMLKYKASDQTVSVGSHGRGIFTGKINENLPCQAPVDLTASSNNPFVVGQELKLYSSSRGGTSYAWSGPSSFTSAVQNPTVSLAATAAMAGVYTVTITSSGSTCTAIATTMVGVNTACTPPTVATAGSNSPVTEGSPINLTSSSTGGTSQSWLGSNGYTSTAQNPVIATLAAGVYNYTVTITSSGTCVATATTTVRVNSAPATCTPPTVTAGSNSPITVGGNIFLTATFPNSGIASWVGPNSYTSTGRNPIIAGATLAAAGVYTVTVASPSTSTCTVMLTVNVVVNPVVTSCTPPTGATASSNSPVTEGSPINLTSSSTGGTSQSWLGSNGYTSTAQNPVIATLAAGVYNFTVTITSSGTCVATATTSVRVNSAPTTCTPPTGATASSNSPVTEGSPINLTSSSTGGTSQSWLGSNGYTSTAQNPVIATLAAGVYNFTVTITSSGTCVATATTSVLVNSAPTSFVVFVNIANTNATQNGNSWATAYSNMQTALSSAPANSDFWVAKGVYKPTATTDRNIAFNIPSGAKLYGGFVGTETMLSQGNVEGNPTILSGEIGSPSTANDNSYHVVTFMGASSATILDGFTVMGGNASFNSTRPPLPTNISTSQPLSIYDGGGIGLDNGSSPTIINCRIISNDAIQGGGLYATNNSNPTVKNSVFMNNQATFGGGIYNLGSNPTYSNILIAGNKATGGAMYNNSSNPTITNVTIAGNGGYNGAVFNSNSAPVIKNSILWGNISPFNDTQSVTSYSIVEGGYLGIGNLNVNPQFISLSPFGLSPSLSGDYKLTNTSPAIDAGDNGVVGMTDTDLGNFPRRFNNGIVDIGAYEFQGSRMGGTVISIVSGNWEQGNTWNIGRKPLAGDTVIIDNNHIVTVNNDGVMKNIEIRPNATLLYKTSGIKLQSGF